MLQNTITKLGLDKELVMSTTSTFNYTNRRRVAENGRKYATERGARCWTGVRWPCPTWSYVTVVIAAVQWTWQVWLWFLMMIMMIMGSIFLTTRHLFLMRIDVEMMHLRNFDVPQSGVFPSMLLACQVLSFNVLSPDLVLRNLGAQTVLCTYRVRCGPRTVPNPRTARKSTTTAELVTVRKEPSVQSHPHPKTNHNTLHPGNP